MNGGVTIRNMSKAEMTYQEFLQSKAVVACLERMKACENDEPV